MPSDIDTPMLSSQHGSNKAAKEYMIGKSAVRGIKIEKIVKHYCRQLSENEEDCIVISLPRESQVDP